MNERIKDLRKALGLTQQEFADRLGIKRGAVANYEIGRNTPIDSVIILLCREFRVNEMWLRTGEGEMFQSVDREKEIAAFAASVLGDPEKDFQRRFISVLAQLSAEQWELMADFADKLNRTEN